MKASPDSPEPIRCDAPCLGYSFTRHEQVLTTIVTAPAGVILRTV